MANEIDGERLQAIKMEIAAIAVHLPEQALTHDFIISRAMQSSDSYRALRSEEEKINISTMLAKAPLDTRINIDFKDFNSKNEPTNPFAPFRQEAQLFSLGAQKYFSSGTSLEAKVTRSHNAISIGGSFPFTNRFYQSEGSFTVGQELWKDGLGKATRLATETAQFQERALSENILVSKKNWQRDLRLLYYQAWLLQNRLIEAKKIKDRRQKLLDLTEIKTTRGTAERPDLLQVRSSLAQADLQVNWLQQKLDDIWHNLVVALNFPDRWLTVDPILIPIKIDNPAEKAQQACSAFARKRASSELEQWSMSDARLQTIKENLNATKNEVERAQNLANPSLKLFFNTVSNGIDAQDGRTYSEVAQFAHPAYTLGVNFSLPLSFMAEKASLQRARADNMRMDALFRQTLAQVKVEWINTCENFQRLKRHLITLQRIVAKQSERGQLEKQRYQLGRTNLFQALLAEDDLTNVLIQEKESMMELNLTAWDILMLTQEGRDYIVAMENKQWNLPPLPN